MFARSLARLAGSGSRSHRTRALLCTAIAVLLALLTAAPAGAVVSEVEGTQVGLQPRSSSLVAPSGAFTNESGNVVLNGTSVYAVYWDPEVEFHHEWVTNLDQFFQQLGNSSGETGTIFAALSQYRDRANTQAGYHIVFKGGYSDTAAYPAGKCVDPEPLFAGQIVCLTDAQLREQLQSFIAARGFPKGMGTVYYLLTPPGVTVCLDGASTHCSDYSLTAKEITEGVRASASYKHSFCSYHGDINPDSAAQGDANTVLYAAIPWSAGWAGDPIGSFPTSGAYKQAFDCQDGGWNPEKHGEKFEAPKEVTKQEQEAFEKGTVEEKQKFETKRRLEGPHIEEPNQEGLGEMGDNAPGLTDVLVNQIAEEQANIVTDPLLESWHNAASHNEATDECRNVFGDTAGPSEIEGGVNANEETEAGTLANENVAGGHVYVNNVINVGSLHGAGCTGGLGLVPRFTSPDPIGVNEIASFDGMESTVSEFKGFVFGPSGPPSTTYATFSWNFGDGTAEVKGYAPGAPTCEAPWLSPCAASAFHAYQYGGTYNVTLTITDVAGHVGATTHQVTVVGPPPPSTGTTPGGAGSGSGGSSGSGSKGAGAASANPIAAAEVVSRSLRKVVHKGLVVRYSVNEKVAGHFEVLIARSLASRLKLGGAPAGGLPAGTPPELVIAKAILITTTGGHSTIVIPLSKHVGERLGHTRKAPLMLRLIVRNASSANPASTTVLSAATLTR